MTEKNTLAFLGFTKQARLYLALVIFLSTTLGILTINYTLVEAAFKTWITLLAVRFVELTSNGGSGRRPTLIFIVVVATVAFYLMYLSEFSMSVVAYFLLLLLLLVFDISSSRNVLSMLAESLLPYYVVTSFFYITRLSRESAVNTLVIPVVTVIVIIKVLSYMLGEPSLVEAHFSALTKFLTPLLNKRFFRSLESGERIVRVLVVNTATRVLRYLRLDLTALENTASIKLFAGKSFRISDVTNIATRYIQQKLVVFFRFLSREFLVLEEKIGKATHELARLVEKLQYAMEHSFMFLFFLMGMLILITILFYVMLTI